MTKRLFALVLVLSLALVAALGCYADSSVSVTYDGSTELKVSSSDLTGFEYMMPGVESSGSFDLVNNSNASVNFYMSTEVLQTLLNEESGSKDTGYRVTMLVNDQVIFGNTADQTTRADEETGTLVGGQGTDELKVLNQDDVLGTDYVLVATLDPHSSAVLEVRIKPDATGTDFTYMDAMGGISFEFRAEEVTPINRTETVYEKGKDIIVTQTRYWLNGVQTGDPVAFAPLVGVLVLAVLVFILAAKKKKKKEE